MAILEKKLPGNRWEKTFTGRDIPEAKGLLAKHGRESYQRAFEKNKGIGFEQITDPSGNPTWLRADQVDEARANGYGRAAMAPRMTMPEVPWPQKKVSPGRHKYKYVDGSVVEVF